MVIAAGFRALALLCEVAVVEVGHFAIRFLSAHHVGNINKFLDTVRVKVNILIKDIENFFPVRHMLSFFPFL